MRKLRIKTTIFLLSILVFFPCCVIATPLPDYLVGTWQVDSVHLNTATGRATEFQWDDPRLVGRIFMFNSKEVSSDAYNFSDKCSRLHASYARVTFPQLIRRSMGGYNSQDQKNFDPVSDYHLSVSKSRKYTAVFLQCQNGLWQGDLEGSGNDSIQGAWMVKADGNIYLRWRDETILILKKINNLSTIRASFDCSKASGNTERAICESYKLRAFDSSIYNAYSRLVNQIRDGGGDIYEIQKSQRDWIKRRNICDSDVKCLKSEMQLRLNFIGSQIQN